MQDKYKSDVESFTVRGNSSISDEGMNYNRGCTDFLCLILFVGAIFSMCVVSIFCYKEG